MNFSIGRKKNIVKVLRLQIYKQGWERYHTTEPKNVKLGLTKLWTNYMKKSGEDCAPTKIKFLGRDDNGGSQWSIGCKTSTPDNKEGLFVNLKASGSTQILECKYLKILGGAC